MAGANYMGGTRNAAKARSKDTTKRTQKNFFGNQRLRSLANGLSVNKNNRDIGCLFRLMKPEGRPRIDLAHARAREPVVSPLPASDAACGSTYFLLSPEFTQDPLCEERESENPNSHLDPPCKWNKKPVSEVFDALDTSDSAAMKVKIERILAMNDLAGLSTLRTPRASSKAVSRLPKRHQSPERNSFSCKRQKADTDHRESSDEWSTHHNFEPPISTSRVDHPLSGMPTIVESLASSNLSIPGNRGPLYREHFSNTTAETHPVGAADNGPGHGSSVSEDFNPMDPYEGSVFHLSDFEACPVNKNSLPTKDVTESEQLRETCPSRLSSPFADPDYITYSGVHSAVEDSILNLDTSLPSSSNSSLGLSVPQIPERSIFARYPRLGPLFAEQSTPIRCTDDPCDHSRFTKSKSVHLLSPHFETPMKESNISLVSSLAANGETLTKLSFNNPSDDGMSNSDYPVVLPGPDINVETHPALAFNQSLSARPYLDEEGSTWNLFDADDPWNAIGSLLGIEPDIPNSKFDDMRKLMIQDRSGVGHAMLPPEEQILCDQDVLPKTPKPLPLCSPWDAVAGSNSPIDKRGVIKEVLSQSDHAKRELVQADSTEASTPDEPRDHPLIQTYADQQPPPPDNATMNKADVDMTTTDTFQFPSLFSDVGSESEEE